MEKKTIGSFIAALRKASGLTQRQLAEKLNVSDKAVSRWERDESAPDLSLIPVIAEIFGVTSDELLRGQRATETAAPERNAVKTEKQIQNILKRTLTRYKICSCISGTVALLGLIAVMILNLGILRAYIGFFVGCAFFLVAALLQLIFQIWFRHIVAAQDILEIPAVSARKSLTLGAQLVFGFILLLLAACLPLIVLPLGPFAGLTAGGWLKYGGIFGLVFAVIWLAGCTIVNIHWGYWRKPDLRSPVNRLRLRWLRNGAVLVLVLAVLHIASVFLLAQNYHLLVQGRKFDDWNDFRRYMETPTDTDGTPLTFLTLEGTGDSTLYIYENQDGGTVVFQKEADSHQLYATLEDEEAGNTPLVRYRHLNRQIQSVRLNRGGLPVQVFTRTQMQIVEVITICVHLLWCAAYLAALRKTIRKYRAEKATL